MHSHPNAKGKHAHKYSCQGKMRKGMKVRGSGKRIGVTHTHPANAMTNSTTHTHPGGGRPHTHNYGK
jgi:hypothetical protein